jgi:hypothetical protein
MRTIKPLTQLGKAPQGERAASEGYLNPLSTLSDACAMMLIENPISRF